MRSASLVHSIISVYLETQLINSIFDQFLISIGKYTIDV